SLSSRTTVRALADPCPSALWLPESSPPSPDLLPGALKPAQGPAWLVVQFGAATWMGERGRPRRCRSMCRIAGGHTAASASRRPGQRYPDGVWPLSEDAIEVVGGQRESEKHRRLDESHDPKEAPAE